MGREGVRQGFRGTDEGSGRLPVCYSGGPFPRAPRSSMMSSVFSAFW